MRILNHLKVGPMQKDFFDLVDFAPKYLKIILFSTLGFCALCLFIFVISYMRVNEIFSFELLSFDNLWIFIFAFVYFFVFAFLALPFNVLAHYLLHKKDKKDFLFRVSFAGVLLILCFLILGLKMREFNPKWLIFCGIILGVYFLFIAACLHFYERKNSKHFFILIFGAFVLLTYAAILFPHAFETGFERFLKTKGLSAARAEIYLKDKQKFVIGRLIFRDSAFAYVRFEDRIWGVGERNVTKILPLESISILKN